MATTIKHVESGIAGGDSFVARHVGPTDADVAEMLGTLGYSSLDELIDATIPERIKARAPLALPAPLTEAEVLARFRAMAAKNRINRSFIGMGYSDCITPPVIQRNIIENPGWY